MTKPSLLLLLLFFFLNQGFGQTLIHMPLNDVSTEIVNAKGDLKMRSAPGIVIDLIPLKLGSRSLATVLKNNGVWYDGESYGWVLRVNGLSNIGDSPTDTLIRIPSVQRNAAGKRLLAKGNFVRLTLDQKVKQSLQQHINSLQRHLAGYTEDIPDSVSNQLQSISGMLSVIELSLKSRSKAVPGAILKQVGAESAMLDNILIQKRGKRSAAVINDIYQDLLTRSAAFNESKGSDTGIDTYPEADIRVNVLDAKGNPVKGLRICLVPPALYGSADEYAQMPTLSSPSSAAFPVANYIVWATASANFRAVTDLYRLELKPAKKGVPLIIDLKYQQQ